MDQPRVFFAVPTYDGNVCSDFVKSLMETTDNKCQIHLHVNGGSLLAFNFNLLWTTALNSRKEHDWSHYLLHHADIAADGYWLDRMLEIMEEKDADILSAVVPIKDMRGLTSTGYRHPPEGDVTRFTMKEVMALPETFSIEDVGERGKGAWLMINTGLMLCNFKKPWVEEAFFSIVDNIYRVGDQWQANCMPEDWHFSSWAAAKGLKVFATRAVKLAHHGRASYRNDRVWGWKTDLGDKVKPEYDNERFNQIAAGKGQAYVGSLDTAGPGDGPGRVPQSERLEESCPA